MHLYSYGSSLFCLAVPRRKLIVGTHDSNYLDIEMWLSVKQYITFIMKFYRIGYSFTLD